MLSFLIRRALPLVVLGSLTLSSCVVREYGGPPRRHGYYRPGPPPPPPGRGYHRGGY